MSVFLRRKINVEIINPFLSSLLLSEKGIEFDMAAPMVVSGIHHKADGPIVIIPLTSKYGNANIEFSFDK